MGSLVCKELLTSTVVVLNTAYIDTLYWYGKCQMLCELYMEFCLFVLVLLFLLQYLDEVVQRPGFHQVSISVLFSDYHIILNIILVGIFRS